MTRSMTDVNNAVSAIHTAIDNSTSTYFEFIIDGLRWEKWPEWYKRVLNTIYFFAEQDEFLYASSNVYEDGEHRAGQIVAYTGSLVVVVDVEHDDQPGSFTSVTARAWPREELTELWVDDIGGDVTHERQIQEWPTRMILKLTYSGGRQVTLPVTKQITREAAADLRRVYPLLLADLAVTQAT